MMSHAHILVSLLLLLFLPTKLPNPAFELQQGGGWEHQAGGDGGGCHTFLLVVEQLVQMQYSHLVQLIQPLLFLQLEGLYI